MAQNHYSEFEKKIIYLSYIMDDVSLESHSVNTYFDKIVTNAYTSFLDFDVTASLLLKLHFYGDSNCKYGGNEPDLYYVQLFKITEMNGSYYLLKFDSKNSRCRFRFSDTLWIRVSGYTLNDLKIFWDKLREKGMNNDQLRSMYEYWQLSDPMFKEIDWECLLSGYLNNETTGECFLSQRYKLINSLCIGCSQRIKGNMNSSFSKIIFYGDIDSDL